MEKPCLSGKANRPPEGLDALNMRSNHKMSTHEFLLPFTPSHKAGPVKCPKHGLFQHKH